MASTSASYELFNFSSIFSIYSTNYVTELIRALNALYCLIALTVIFSLIFALFLEESGMKSVRFSYLITELLPISISSSLIKDVERTAFSPKEINKVNTNFYEVGNHIILSIRKFLSHYMDKLFIQIHYFIFKWMDVPKNQIVYRIEKLSQGLTVRDDELDIESYLDMKYCLMAKDRWPFMLKLENVKEKYVKCNNKNLIPMSSYCYLNFLSDPRVQNAAIEAAKMYSTGNHGPRFLGGNNGVLVKLEETIAKFFGHDASLVFATGFLACMSIMSAICRKDDVVFVDRRIHASIRIGLKVCECKNIQYFDHNSPEACEKLMKKYCTSKHLKKSENIDNWTTHNVWLILESVYSMDGTLCDLPRFYELSLKYNAKIVMDEAHGLGIVGKTGRGVQEYFNLKNSIYMHIGTLSKSAGGVGGYVAGNKRIIDFLDFHTPGNLFSTPLTAYSAGGAIEALRLMDLEIERIQKAQFNSRYFRKALKDAANTKFPPNYQSCHKFTVGGHEATPVLPIIFDKDIDRVIRIACEVQKYGFYVSAVAYPACPLSKPRLRITATSAYDKKIMDDFVDALVKSVISCEPTNPELLKL